MLLKIFKNRTVSSSGTWGTKNENNYEILNFEFPEELEEYNKRIVYYLGNQKVWDAIIDNKAILTNAITTKGSVKAYIWCTKSDEAFETDVDFRTQIFVMNFFENDNADGIVPTPEQVDGFNTMLTEMNEKIEEIDELETTIKNAEAQRQENEETRQNNEKSRQENEQTRQNQEAERERRTDEAIADIQDKTAEYNANAEAKTNEFNDLVNVQKLSIENYGETQLNAIGRKGQQALGSITTTTQFALQNISLAQQTGVSAVETASSEATTNFNTNATNKTNAFNDNATQKTTNFDNNASEKTDEFNTNAQNKIDEYDEHIVEYQAQIDELQEEVEELSENMPWNETEQGTYLDITDAAKYSKNKLELFGNTEQTQYTGKNLYDYENSTNTQTYNTNAVKENNGFRGGWGYRINLSQPILAGTYTFSIEVDGDSNSSNANIKLLDENKTTISNTSMNAHHSNNISFTTTQDIHYIQVDNGNSTNTVLIYNIQIEEGSTATKYEPYVGGAPSPSPDYPQDIHVVTGNNSIGVQGKNLANLSILNQVPSTTNGELVTFGGAVCTELIEIDNTKDIVFSFSQTESRQKYVMFYGENQNYLGYSLGMQTNWLLSNNTNYSSSKYVRIRFDSKATTNWCQLEYNSIATDFEPYTHADYPINLGNIELCKIGNYQDYLYKENGNWYKYGAINKIILDGTTETWGGVSTPGNFKRIDLKNTGALNAGSSRKTYALCTISRASTVEDYNINFNYQSNIFFYLPQGITTRDEWRALLSQKTPELYYILEVATITQITDETLTSQLDEIYEHLKLVKGTNNISITASDLAPYMELSYMQDLPSKLDKLDSRLSLLE